MRTLTPTLLAAQRADSAAPYFEVRLTDRDVGSVRLRWERWYEGSEPDGPCAAAVPADGSLVRARIDPADGAIYAQRVASPSESSDFASWPPSLGSAKAGARLGLSAAGARVLLATVVAGDGAIEIRESTDSGATFRAGETIVDGLGTVTAIACALRAADGGGSVFYAVAGEVFTTSREGGA